MSKEKKGGVQNEHPLDKELEKILEYDMACNLASDDGEIAEWAKRKAIAQIKSAILKELLERMPERKEWEVIDHQDYGYNEALEDCLEVIEETLQ